MDELRTRIIYDYGRWDFEQEVEDYAGGLGVKDAEWATIQADLQEALNLVADALVRDAVHKFLSEHKVLGFYPIKESK